MSLPDPPELPDGNIFPEVQEAKRRGYTCNWTWDGEHEGLEVRNANDSVLSSINGPIEFQNDDGTIEPDWARTIRLELIWALAAEERREARRPKTRLRRAWAALHGDPQT